VCLSLYPDLLHIELTIYASAILFALNSYRHHSLSLSEAYARSVYQFRALRSEHHIATTVAVKEAETLGSEFGPSEIEQTHEMEKRSLATWERQAELDEGAIAARKRWKAIVDKQPGANQWTKGVEYVRLWNEGIRPNYMPPSLTDPVPQDAFIHNLPLPGIDRSS
jgi:small subunit ribosomal protein S23